MTVNNFIKLINVLAHTINKDLISFLYQIFVYESVLFLVALDLLFFFLELWQQFVVIVVFTINYRDYVIFILSIRVVPGNDQFGLLWSNAFVLKIFCFGIYIYVYWVKTRH